MNVNAKQIEALDFNYLDQSETYQYSVDQLARVKSSPALMAKVGSEVNAWEAATQAFDTAFRKASTSSATQTVKTLDNERDSYYTGFTGTVNNALKSPLQAQRDAAQMLLEPIRRYNVNVGGEYQQQTMRTAQLCQDLLDNFAEPLATLGLTEWVQALQAKNTEFQQAMTARTNDQAGYIRSELTLLRQNIITTYRIFVKLANVVFIYEGDTAYATVIDQLNAEVRHYKQIIARKSGGSSSNQNNQNNQGVQNNSGNSGNSENSENSGNSGNSENSENSGNSENNGGEGTNTNPTNGDDPEIPGSGGGEVGGDTPSGGGGTNNGDDDVIPGGN